MRAAVWDALAIRHVPTRILVVPDGSLFRVNFAALPDGDGFLVEAGWHMHTLDSEQDLALTKAAPAARLVLLGAPDFGQPEVRDDGVKNDACATQFTPLPGTTVEINRLARLWRATTSKEPRVLTGRSANKKNLRLAGADADVIHIATHAVDLNDTCTSRLAFDTRRERARVDAGRSSTVTDGRARSRRRESLTWRARRRWHTYQ